MSPEISQLDQPIDVMYLIHHAIRAEARRTRRAAEQLEMGGNFKSFTEVFYRWAMALGYHEETEYKYIIPFIRHTPPARQNESGHKALLEGLEDLQGCLHEELGRMVVIPRTQRQLFGKVIALLIAQADLLEEEEEIVLPVIRQQISEEQQIEMARRLLLDLDSEDERWMLDWVAQNISETERQALEQLVVRFDLLPSTLPPLPSDDKAQHPVASTSPAAHETPRAAERTLDEHPIDVMYLIHKALSAEAWHTERLAERLEIGESLQPFLLAFDRWAAALGFHAVAEDTAMTPLLPASPQARDNEATHQRLGQRLEDLQTYLRDIEPAAVTTRTRRRLFGKVVALRIDQDDHLEEEEEFVLPIIRQRLGTAQQLDMARRLLLDPQAEDEAWVLEWLVQDLTASERQALSDLTARFATMRSTTG
jgi:hypothetical protein